MYKFKVGDKIKNVDSHSYNYGRTATVVGFHRVGTGVFVKYDDGTYGASIHAEVEYESTEVQEMTMDEVCRALGKNIKIKK